MEQLSKNEQDYLKTIYYFENAAPSIENDKSVTIHSIAKKLHVSSPSATEMIKRLSKKKLVIYNPYHGVNLSDLGKNQARFIIKSHRVWETFLLEKLGYSSEEVHEEAENLEHASSPKLVECLYACLGYPEKDPHGAQIPTELFWVKNEVEINLMQAKEKQRYNITIMDEVCKIFFKKLELPLPHLIKIIEKLPDHSLIIREDNGTSYVIPEFLQSKIQLVQRN